MNETISTEERDHLLKCLKERFENNANRHQGLNWQEIEIRLQEHPDKLWSLNQMEKSGGEPALFGYNSRQDKYIFFDFSKESPSGRRSACYDREALEARKKFKPKKNVIDSVKAMGVELLTEDQYRDLQKLENFDTKTSSWIATPEAIRKLGGALFADYRYGKVFIYHNGAESYYASRGFRTFLEV